VALVYVGLRTFVIEAFRIPTGSMENTLLVGDFLLVNKVVYGAQIPGTQAHLPALEHPRRGDVVVFLAPNDPGKYYVKRLVGLPGDTLQMRAKQLFRDGRPVHEPYAIYTDFGDDPTYPAMMWQLDYLAGHVDRSHYRPSRDNWGPIVVPSHRYFMLGDNRDDSEDSRYWGFVDDSAVEGRPLIVYYSFNPRSDTWLPWLEGIRWHRIGDAIH
jgi:signal peptidase I